MEPNHNWPNRNWWHPSLYAGSSVIHGKGLFAGKQISQWTAVFKAGGQLVSKKAYELIPKRNKGMVLPVRSGEFYLIEQCGSLINHSCSPNLVLDGDGLWRAWRDISVDEELTTDYSTFVDMDMIVIESCLCGKAECRKEISLKAWMDKDLQQLYGRHFSSEILEKLGIGNILGNL